MMHTKSNSEFFVALCIDLVEQINAKNSKLGRVKLKVESQYRISDWEFKLTLSAPSTCFLLIRVKLSLVKTLNNSLRQFYTLGIHW